MVHFLRNKYNQTIIECEGNKGVFNPNSISDITTGIDIRIYSIELINSKNQPGFYLDFSRLNELRRIWWENEPDEDESIDDFIREEYLRVANKYGYNYVID